MHHDRPVARRPPRKRSLNHEVRKQDLIRITRENQFLLKRLQGKQPYYNISLWEDDRRRNEKLLKHMCAFPYQFAVMNEGGRSHTRMRQRPAASSSVPKRKAYLSPLSKHVVFDKAVSISGRNFQVKILKKKGALDIQVFQSEALDSYSLRLPNKDARNLMGDDSNYEEIVQMLAMEQDELVLVEPELKEELKEGLKEDLKEELKEDAPQDENPPQEPEEGIRENNEPTGGVTV